MIFDRLAAIAERFIPELRHPMREARIFKFPGRFHEVAKEEQLEAETMQFLQEQFFLPFPFVAIEDTASCVLLWDSKPDQIGLKDESRFFVECMPVNAPLEEFADAKEVDAGTKQRMERLSSELSAALPPESCVVTLGQIESYEYRPEDSKKVYCKGRGAWQMVASKREVSHKPVSFAEINAEVGSDVERESIRNAMAALEEVMFFNSPSRFIFEEAPAKTPNPKFARPVPRSPARPLYTLLTPQEIRERLRLPPLQEGGPKTPHERRRHYRTLRSEFFKNKQGQTIVIPACWVGPSEAVHGAHRYKVRLDL